MRTYTHGAIGYLLYARRPRSERHLAALGGVLPDVILAIGFIFHVAEPRSSLQWVADAHALLHFSVLHEVTVVLHSLVLMTPLLALAWILRPTLVPLFVGIVAHSVVDLFTHQKWAYNHFHPLPLPPLHAPLSYTDATFTVLEHIGVVVFVVWVVRRRRGEG
ncbi:MAG: hypothetical protein RQ745_07790 [Longimicrobiales bacterium]|nr:hypothetical protein [Longimicrobiales bacterium]